MIRLALDAGSARFWQGDRALTGPLPLGAGLLRARWVRHDPPQPQELEAVIEAVEDVVMPLHRLWPADDTLQVHAPQLDLGPLAAARTRDELESLFDRAAAVAQGRPRSSDPDLADPQRVAALVVLREVMHHLGFIRLEFAAP